jgi:hypothetical protein
MSERKVRYFRLTTVEKLEGKIPKDAVVAARRGLDYTAVSYEMTPDCDCKTCEDHFADEASKQEVAQTMREVPMEALDKPSGDPKRLQRRAAPGADRDGASGLGVIDPGSSHDGLP